jgi:hypothetical protein
VRASTRSTACSLRRRARGERTRRSGAAYGGRAAALRTALLKTKARAPVLRGLLRETVVTARRLGANCASSSALAVTQRSTFKCPASLCWLSTLVDCECSSQIRRKVPKTRTATLQAFSDAWGEGGGVLMLFRAAPVHIAPLVSFEGAGDALALSAVQGRSVGAAVAAAHQRETGQPLVRSRTRPQVQARSSTHGSNRERVCGLLARSAATSWLGPIMSIRVPMMCSAVPALCKQHAVTQACARACRCVRRCTGPRYLHLWQLIDALVRRVDAPMHRSRPLSSARCACARMQLADSISHFRERGLTLPKAWEVLPNVRVAAAACAEASRSCGTTLTRCA